MTGGGDSSFSTRTIRGADSLSSRTFDRFAPAGPRSPGVSALSFSDRLMQPYFTSARQHRERVTAGNVGQRPVTEDVTWLFPVPWYSDELSWLMAEASGPTRPAASGAPGRPAPSAAPSRPARQPRSFSPLVPMAAVSAAELVADLLSPAAPSAERSVMAESVGDLTMLSATAWSEPAARTPRQRRATPSARPRPTPRPAPTPEAGAAPRPPATERARAAELLAEVARSGDFEQTRFASAPPLGLRPQLHELDAAVAAVDQLEAPLVSYRAERPAASPAPPPPRVPPTAGAAPSAAAEPTRWIPRSTAAATRTPEAARSALASVSERPRSLGHVAWADRWLARFAGAAPTTLGSLEAAGAPDPATAFEAVFVAPAQAPTAPARRPADSPRAVPTPATPPPRLPDDDESVSDEVFAAISQQIAQDRQPGVWVQREHQVPPGPRGPAPSALAQRALAAPVAWRSPGLAAGLGSSPAMPALAATLDAPVGPTFDVRALSLPPAVAGSPDTDEPLGALAPEPVYVDATAAAASEPAVKPAALPRAAAHRAPSAERERDRAVTEASAMVRRSPTPGAVGQMARSFGISRALVAGDLAYDFVPPEVLSAARIYGFDAHEAAGALRLAEGGEGPLAALKDAVAMTFIQAVSPSVTDTHRPAPAPESIEGEMAPAPELVLPPAPALTRAADALPPLADTRAQAQGLVGARRARGATLWPEPALAHLGIHRDQAEHTQPGIESALEVLAAGAVADAAVWVSAIEPGLELDEVLAPTAAAMRFGPAAALAPRPIEPEPDPQLSLFDLDADFAAAPEMIPLAPGTVGSEPEAEAAPSAEPFAGPAMTPAGPGATPAPGPELEAQSPGADAPWVRAATSALPAAVRPAFESIYAVLAGDPQTRALPPAERAARALAVARRSTDDQPMSARARAAMAWSVLPTVIAGGSPPEIAAAILGPAGDEAAPAERAADPDRAAPGVYPDPLTPVTPPAPRPRHYAAPTAAPTLVRTGPSAQMYREAAAQAAQGERTAQAAMPTMETIANTEGIPDWFLEAAQQIAGDGQSSASSSGISLAEMTLVTGAPGHQVAASPRTASESSTRSQAAATPATEGEQDEQDKSPDIEEMVHELAGMLRDYFDIQRMRNGEP